MTEPSTKNRNERGESADVSLWTERSRRLGFSSLWMWRVCLVMFIFFIFFCIASRSCTHRSYIVTCMERPGVQHILPCHVHVSCSCHGHMLCAMPISLNIRDEPRIRRARNCPREEKCMSGACLTHSHFTSALARCHGVSEKKEKEGNAGTLPKCETRSRDSLHLSCSRGFVI
jgi:hypothetical protein